MAELAAWVGHRRRRVEVRRATKQQLLTQTDQCFPGLAAALSSVLGTKVGRLVIEHFADPAPAGLSRSRCVPVPYISDNPLGPAPKTPGTKLTPHMLVTC